MKNSTSPVSLDTIRHSLAHLLAMAVLKKFPKAKLGIGPVIEYGFYYDFKLPKPITDTDLAELEKSMREFIAAHLDFTGENVTPLKAKKIFKDQPFKLDLIKEFAKEKKQLTIYHTGPKPSSNPRSNRGQVPSSTNQQNAHFVDLCRGGHIENTSQIDPEAFALQKIAGAYWKGDEKKASLVRIYGLAFGTKKELDAHCAFLEEARKRDHKRLGPELDLFTFSDLVGSGLPLWTPKGTLLRNILDTKVWELRKARGYAQVDIPHLAKKDLYEKSGHWDKFKDELFKIVTREGHLFAMKPMNCPHHIQIFNRRQWSWRDLPQRYASTTKVYRDEQSGELAGLARVRAITQDDAHVFCRRSQMREEIFSVWDIINEFYALVGFSLRVRLSLRDPKEPKKYLGAPEVWQEAETVLRALIKEKGIQAEEGIGEAAFYGPKLDFMAKDSLGREWQVATIQLDMNLPERFDLTYVNEKGEKERIVMIHAAIMGSIERYLAILIEHFAGAFPFWLAPVQVILLPINDKIMPYVSALTHTLESRGLRTATDTRNESIGKKIREAEMQKIPYLLIIGEREAAAKTIAVRARGKDNLGAMDIDTFITLATAKEK